MDQSYQTLNKSYHHGDLRNALITAGADILAKSGVQALNLREVARHAGVSHMAPYRHFADKQALIEAIAEEGFRQLWCTIEQAMIPPSISTAENLIMLGQAYVQFAMRHPNYFRIMFGSARNQPKSQQLYIASKAGFQMLIEILQRGQTEGEIIQNDSFDQAKMLWTMMHGLAILIIDNQFTDAGDNLSDYANNLVRQCILQVINGLKKPTQPAPEPH